jgi:YidC/Oxa1 family membrane protein insertase
MEMLSKGLGYVMNFCYNLLHDYGMAIILFTLISKIVLLPVSIWVQKNSIKMVKMQPDINRILIKHYGDKDEIAEEQSKLYKKEKYNPMASLIPLAIQIILLLGVVAVIKDGINAGAANMKFCGYDLTWITTKQWGISIITPIIAGVSAWLLCVAQNASNVLQAEQSKLNKYGMMIFSVGLSLYLGCFVYAGVALYWTASNILAILQLYLLNWAINPKKYVDYEALEATKKELAEIEALGTKKGKRSKEDIKREKADYKKFFSIVNKHLVFYSESSGFYKYYKGIIEYILDNTNITIHYITSDPKDQIFDIAKKESKIRPYYIDEKRLITLMMKMDADVVVMTMPDIENFHIKRSYIRKDINYVYVPHCMDSMNMTMRKGSIDHYDSVLCTGKLQKEETLKTEIAYGLPKKELVEWGYSLLDDMKADYEKLPKTEHDKKSILIAPSWQKDNIVDNCLEELLDNLKGHGYKITVRPHPQHVRHMPEKMEGLKEHYKSDDDIEIQMDFSSNSTVFEADMMITDWSGIAYEYAYTTFKPVLFIDTPMKVMNPEYTKIDVEPMNIWMREEIGKILKLDEIDKASHTVEEMLNNSEQYKKHIEQLVSENVYNIGHSAEVGGKYIISQIQKAIDRHKKIQD